MNQGYKEIQFSWGSNIDDAVNDLLEFKEKGKLVYGVFNGTALYSDTVTVDGAYKKIIGKTKAEFDKDQQEWRDNYKKQELEHEEKIPELAKEWSMKGREVLTEDKWDHWDEIVPIRLGDLYRGMELGNCLDIVKVLNDGRSLDEAKRVIANQGHSGMSYGLVKSMVSEFCDRGKDFVEYIS